MTGRDRLRELLDAVLDEEHRSLAEMARGAYSSPFHFSRRLVRDAGEPPVAMRRRVALGRAAWQLSRGPSVTDAAFAAGYGSVEGFARAFARAYGHPPGAVPAGPATGSALELEAPNGIHFHAPAGLVIPARATNVPGEVTALMVHHDVDTLAWSDEPLDDLVVVDADGAPIAEPIVTSDPPPWWRAHKKNALFYNGMARGDHRGTMALATSVCVDDVPRAQQHQVLGDRRPVDAERGLQLGDRALAVAEQLQQPQPHGVAERLEQLGLDLVDGCGELTCAQRQR